MKESKVKPLKYGVCVLKHCVTLLLFCTFACAAFAQQAQTQRVTRPQGRPVIEQKQQPRVTEHQESPQKTLDRATDILQLVAKMIGVLVALIAILLAIAGLLGFFEYRRWKEIREEAQKGVRVIQQLREQAESDAEKIRSQVGTLSLYEYEKLSSKDKAKLDELSRRLEWVEAFGGSLTAEDYVRRGISLFEKGKAEFALEAFNKAIEIEPDHVGAWLNKGWVLGEIGRHEEALKAFDKGIELKPDFIIGWLNKGIALGKLKRYDEAIKILDKVIESKPDHAPALYERACIHARDGKKPEALSDLKRVIELDASYKEKAKKDEDFKDLWDDPDFKKLIE